jgi:hypothetical protein
MLLDESGYCLEGTAFITCTKLDAVGFVLRHLDGEHPTLPTHYLARDVITNSGFIASIET